MPHLQLQQLGLQNRSQTPLPKFGQIFIADHISDACKTQVTVDEQPYCHSICIQLRELAVIDIHQRHSLPCRRISISHTKAKGQDHKLLLELIAIHKDGQSFKT